MNTAFEFLADATHPSFHPLIGKAKDVAAGAVAHRGGGGRRLGRLFSGLMCARCWPNSRWGEK